MEETLKHITQLNSHLMFVLSAGMPKSGSTLLNLYQCGLLSVLFPSNGQIALERRIKDGSIDGIGNFINDLDKADTLEAITKLSLEIGPFVVKTHIPLNPILKRLILEKQILATYIHRDPRDVILSAIDHGRRPMKNPATNNYFLQFTDVGHAAPIVKEFCKTAIDWITFSIPRIYTYNLLLTNPRAILEDFCVLLGVAPDKILFNELILQYTASPVKGKQQFNEGRLLRFHETMSLSELDFCSHYLSEEIIALGYSVKV